MKLSLWLTHNHTQHMGPFFLFISCLHGSSSCLSLFFFLLSLLCIIEWFLYASFTFGFPVLSSFLYTQESCLEGLCVDTQWWSFNTSKVVKPVQAFASQNWERRKWKNPLMEPNPKPLFFFLFFFSGDWDVLMNNINVWKVSLHF